MPLLCSYHVLHHHHHLLLRVLVAYHATVSPPTQESASIVAGRPGPQRATLRHWCVGLDSCPLAEVPAPPSTHFPFPASPPPLPSHPRPSRPPSLPNFSAVLCVPARVFCGLHRQVTHSERDEQLELLKGDITITATFKLITDSSIEYLDGSILPLTPFTDHGPNIHALNITFRSTSGSSSKAAPPGTSPHPRGAPPPPQSARILPCPACSWPERPVEICRREQPAGDRPPPPPHRRLSLEFGRKMTRSSRCPRPAKLEGVATPGARRRSATTATTITATARHSNSPPPWQHRLAAALAPDRSVPSSCNPSRSWPYLGLFPRHSLPPYPAPAPSLV